MNGRTQGKGAVRYSFIVLLTQLLCDFFGEFFSTNHVDVNTGAGILAYKGSAGPGSRVGSLNQSKNEMELFITS